MDKKENQQEGNGNNTPGTLEKARSTIMKTLGALVPTLVSGQPTPIPAPAPSTPTQQGTSNNHPASNNVDPSRNPAVNSVKPPKDLNQLLRVCAELSGNSPNKGAQDSGGDNVENAQERRQFLANAIMSLGTAGNVIEELKESIRRLSPGPSDSAETIEEQLKDLKFISYHVDDLDLANDFLKIGGLPQVLKYLDSGHGPTRKETFNILAVVPQNNPFAWSFYERLNVLPIILDKLVQEGFEEAFDYGFTAVSCLIRGNENAILQLKGNNGEDLIYTILLSSERSKTIRKAGYILRSLILFDKEHNGDIEIRGYYKAILQELSDRIRLRKGSRDCLGAVLQVIYYILSEHQELLSNYIKPEVGLVTFVKEVLEQEPTEEDDFEVMECYNAASDLKSLVDPILLGYDID